MSFERWMRKRNREIWNNWNGIRDEKRGTQTKLRKRDYNSNTTKNRIKVKSMRQTTTQFHHGKERDVSWINIIIILQPIDYYSFYIHFIIVLC